MRNWRKARKSQRHTIDDDYEKVSIRVVTRHLFDYNDNEGGNNHEYA
jgi:hypothetical protein